MQFLSLSRHPTPPAFCWHSHAGGTIHQMFNARRPCLPSGLSTCMEQPAVICQECIVPDDVPSRALEPRMHNFEYASIFWQQSRLGAQVSSHFFKTTLTVCSGWQYHRLRGSASTVLTATGQVNGRWRILTPHRIETHEPIAIKFRTIDYVRERTPQTKFGTNPSIGGFWAYGWNITFLCLFYLYLFFWDSRTGQTGRWIFTRDSSLSK